ncbi:hypothetical protein PHJA_001508200 [Phtheirospermum japonicum]|uniref:Pectinesterase inhibitor domain-containing protein n=1 Tax=Phtheirospermum japonicum TaxID=374723 RepID=A0A830C9D7_9LAMI|nr:hypothetical protein PHJA_001508200 [Phtheirospermum japonicum]
MAGGSCFSILAATFLLLATAATASRHPPHRVIGGVSPFCTTATTNPDDKAVCTGLVKGAGTWPEAMTNAIKAVIATANAAKPMVDGLEAELPRGLKPATVESIAKGCKDTFDTYVFNLEQCIGFVKNDPFSSLEVYLGGSTFFDCKDGFDEFQIPNPEVDKFYDTTVKFADILLSIYQKKPLH